MARIRSIKPEFWTSEQIAECSPNARLLFIGLWSFCDDSGVHPASVARLKMEVFPADDFTRAQIADMVQELVKAGLLIAYEIGGESYWMVTGWKHQKIDQPTYKHPLPDGTTPGNIRRASFAESDSPNKNRREFTEDSPSARGTFGDHSPPERSGEEGKGEEGKEQGSRGSRLPTDWRLPEDWRAWAKSERQDLDIETEAARFADYWHGVAGAKGRKADWPATWRNWIRNARGSPVVARNGSAPREPAKLPDLTL